MVLFFWSCQWLLADHDALYIINVQCQIVNVIIFFFKLMMDILDLEVSMEEIHTYGRKREWPALCQSVLTMVTSSRLLRASWLIGQKYTFLFKKFKLLKKRWSKPNVRRNLKGSMLWKSNLPLSQSQIKTLSIQNYLSHRNSKSDKEVQQMPESPRKTAQTKRKFEALKSLQNTIILSENLDPDIINSRYEKL